MSIKPPEEADLVASVGDALDKLPGDVGQLLRESFGIGGEPARSPEEIAEDRGVSERQVREIVDDGLRALMGYGKLSKPN